MHKIEREIRSAIKHMDECDQPYEDIYEEIIRLVNKQHDEWYNEARIALQEKEEALRKCEKYKETLKWYGELPCIQENQIGWNVGYVARQSLRGNTQ